jgi:hypothetical protein
MNKPIAIKALNVAHRAKPIVRLCGQNAFGVGVFPPGCWNLKNVNAGIAVTRKKPISHVMMLKALFFTWKPTGLFLKDEKYAV